MYKPRRSSPLTPPHSNDNSPEPESDLESFPSPTETLVDKFSELHSSKAETDDEMDFDGKHSVASSNSTDFDSAPPTPPVSPPARISLTSTSSTASSSLATSPPSPTKTKLHPYPRPNGLAQPHAQTLLNRSSRPRMVPMTSLPNSSPLASGSHTPGMPKSQPLSRALFARMANDVPHAGSGIGPKKKTGGEKLIVPTKSFRTTFELGLTASEFARR